MRTVPLALKTPWLTLILVGVMFGVFCVSVEDKVYLHALWYSRTDLLNGDGWRLVTGHLVHFSFAHLGENLLAFAALAILIELRQGSRVLAFLLLLLALVSSALMLVLTPDLLYYGGISSINYGLSTWLCLTHAVAREGFVIGGWRIFPARLVIAGLLAHIGLQYVTARSLFSATPSDAIVIAWQTHLACTLMALLLAFSWRHFSGKPKFVSA